MPGLVVTEADRPLQDGYTAPFCRSEGPARSTLFHPAGYSLWEVEAQLGPGAVLSWGGAHGDEVVFVVDGELEVDGRTCAAGTAVVIEAGVLAEIGAITDSRVLHFGPASAFAPTDGPLGPPRRVGQHVHVVTRPEAPLIGSPDGPGGIYYADSSCQTCRLAFFEVFNAGPQIVDSHTHSQDEIIRVTSGELHIGRTLVRAGMSVAIAGGHRYGFRTKGAFSFLNYRRDASWYVAAPGSVPVLEGVEAARRIRSAEHLG
ncbi:MAG: hypothetical protein J2P57_03000 [Acidimicrobiaceae bacterium]|nr:hypothetical protein [Acidimicrobiaceae bacterium]